jgi:cytochrome P450
MRAIESARFDDPAFYLDDPNATFRELRAADPVHWYDEGRFWVVTRYDDIKQVSSQPGTFRSSRIAILMDLIDARHGRDPVDLGGHRGVMFMDPPEHGAHRKAVSVRFTPKAVQEMESHVRAVIRDILDRLPDGELDWITAVAEPVPVYVFSQLLGVPEADWGKVSGWATTIASVGSGQATDADKDLIFNEIGPYLLDLTVQRKADPTDDLLTMLTTVEIDGVPFDEVQVLTYALTLLAAGSETTQSLIAGMADCLDRFPDQAALLFADPSLAAGAVEETLRWWTPVMSMARQAAADVDLRGVRIASGDGLLLAYASGNRDEDRWGPTAEDFAITRPDASGHLGFGFGEHFCMGAHLARREARILLEELAQRARGIEVVGERVPRRSALVHTHDSLPVRLLR